jgi:hypothetical protein
MRTVGVAAARGQMVCCECLPVAAAATPPSHGVAPVNVSHGTPCAGTTLQELSGTSGRVETTPHSCHAGWQATRLTLFTWASP